MKKATEETRMAKKSVQVTQEAVDETNRKKREKEDQKEIPHSYALEIAADVANRAQYKVVEDAKGYEEDMTPKLMPEIGYSEHFEGFNIQIKDEMERQAMLFRASRGASSRTRSSVRAGVGANKQSIDDLMSGIAHDTIIFDAIVPFEKAPELHLPTTYRKSFIKISLHKSPFKLLHSQPSTTAARNTAEGDEVERDNRYYDYLTIGKGKVRRRSDNDAQTNIVLTTTRCVNTIVLNTATVGCYVSNFEMYDTVHNVVTKQSMHPTMHSLARSIDMDDLDEQEEDEFEREKLLKQDKQNRLFDSIAFKNAIMLMGRALSSNMYERGMRRFRNFNQIDRFAEDVSYNYSMNLLFRCVPSPSNDERKAVSDISFCRSNGDIFVVGYGLYSFSSQHVPRGGDVFVWSIKNPGEPERAFYYKIPVTAVCFSPYLPSLIAIGMYDGSVEVRDISTPGDHPIAVSQRSTSPGCSPVVAIRWIKQAESDDATEVDPFLSLSQDGSVTRFRIIKSPFLLGFNQMTLERVEGHPEGIHVPISPIMTCESNRHPQGLNITTHPLHKDIYYVLTDEGCIHKCSINYQHQYLEVLKCHDGGVNVMEFSPWSPKLFLTCGNDWCVRIWVEGITRPLLLLQDDFQPIHWASWSPTHSTIIVSLNRETAQIWDIRRNILKPMAKHEMDSSYNTVGQFSNCGRTMVVGNERGNVLFQALDDMPFPAHFQYDELEKAIYKAIGNDQELLIELKSVGFFGYPNKKSMQSV